MNNEERADRIAQEMVANLNYNVLKEAAEQDKHNLLSLLFKALKISIFKLSCIVLSNGIVIFNIL